MHSYRNLQEARFNVGIVPGQAELTAIRVVVVIAVVTSLLGVLI
jgi:hypothetical protein